ncbi:MAG: hypothetical protein CL946_05255 [Ectothiorhodospiraceae bacterium]|nr:hypothetical protein [Ectothiorhodospiraceae bacterium]
MPEPKKYHLIVGSVVVATLFWFSVTMSGAFKAHFNVPLAVANLPEDMAVASELPEEVEVTLEGSGWQLLFLSVSHQMKFVMPGNRLSKSRTIQLASVMRDAMELPSGLSVVSAYPESITVDVDRMITKTVPLRYPVRELTFKPGFGLSGEVQLSPDSVTLQGADRVLDGITSWPIETKSYKDLSLPVLDVLPVEDSLGSLVDVSPATVQLTIPVEQLADMEFTEVPVEVQDVPDGKEVLLANATVSVYVRGGVNTLSNLEDTDFMAILDYARIEADTSGMIDPRMNIPAGVTLLKIEPEVIRYTVRQDEDR